MPAAAVSDAFSQSYLEPREFRGQDKDTPNPYRPHRRLRLLAQRPNKRSEKRRGRRGKSKLASNMLQFRDTVALE